STIFAQGGSSINIPRTQWKSKNKNLLPDDKHFSSKNLVKLFLKPKGTIRNGLFSQPASNEEIDADEHFWANQYQNNNEQDAAAAAAGPEGDYDANFFHDDDDVMPLANYDDFDDDDAPADIQPGDSDDL